MGCYDRAEVCELVGTFILNKWSNIIDKNSSFYRISNSLYRDDGLDVFDKLPGPQIEQRKTKIIKIFKDCGLSITVSINMTSILHLTLNLKTESYHLFIKPNNNPIYIDTNSNHPTQILK